MERVIQIGILLEGEKMNDNIKKYKKFVAAVTVMCIVFSGCSKAKEENKNDIDSVKLKSNQELVVCKLTAIYGNEIEYTVVKEQSMSENKSDNSKDKMSFASSAPDMSEQNNTSENKSRQDNISGSNGRSQRENGSDMPAGNPPDMGGEMPQGGGAPDMGEQNSQGSGSLDRSANDVKSGKSEAGQSSSKNGSESSKKIYTLTDETGSTMIPVGTDVVTALGKTTTFSRLSNGDIIKMIFEKDSSGKKVVVGVWIVS